MTQSNTPQQSLYIESFINTSREYFSLPRRKSTANPQAFGSSTTLKAPRAPISSYRKVVQSFLLAAGIGSFVVAPAMAELDYVRLGGYTERHAKILAQHHHQLHDALKLTADQEPSWKQLLVSEQPGAALSGGQPEDWAKLTAPERAEKMLELSKARQLQMADYVAALKTFYAVLSPEQQKTYEDFHAVTRSGVSSPPNSKSSSTSQRRGLS